MSRNLFNIGGRSMRSGSGTCVFLSHRSSDKDIAYRVALAFDYCGVDYYLDAADDQLQAATAAGDAARVVGAIERGIERSTHLLGIITPKTRGSWWVPYEIGYSRATEKSSGASLLPADGPYQRTAYLVLPGVTDLPEYIQISTILPDQTSLLQWIGRLYPGVKSLPHELQDLVPMSRTMRYVPS